MTTDDEAARRFAERAGVEFAAPAPWQASAFATRSPRTVVVLGGSLVLFLVALAVVFAVHGPVGAAIGFGVAAVVVALFYGYGLRWNRANRAVAERAAIDQRARQERRLLASPWFYTVALPIGAGFGAAFRVHEPGEPLWEWFLAFGIGFIVVSVAAVVSIAVARRRQAADRDGAASRPE